MADVQMPTNSSGEHYNLRWNSYTHNLIKVLLEHQHYENLVDVTLCCEGQFVKAHKLVLSACSELFQDMFKMHNEQHPIIILNGIKFNHFKHILEFIYQGEVKVLDVDLEGVLTLGESLQVKGLSSIKLTHQLPTEEINITSSDENTNVPNRMPTLLPVVNCQSLVNTTNNTQRKPKDVFSDPQPRLIRENNCDTVRLNEYVAKNVATNVIPKKSLSKLDNTGTEGHAQFPQRKRIRSPEEHYSSVSNNAVNTEKRNSAPVTETDKVSKPVSAFMLFANEWRKKLAVEHPEDNNKAISVKLGNMWKSLSNETRQSYYMAANKMGEENPGTGPKKKRPPPRRKTVDSISHLVSVNLQELDDDDDLQIIETNEEPINVDQLRHKKQRYTKNQNNT